ncbi:neither inactivation nor afterpotential protein C-like [Rhagoletis pomonella]|uniref:neither inactivation nor afterpotential protein C-like n=2 Tax=Rhagoletis TaxID=28609 RepID=UPI001783BCC1|nr:neither inactivation nor afterpotential protein C-like [Rhagoletis pomonella]
MVQQQMKALGVLDTIAGRQLGYSCRITFQEFLRRYQFLAFDFDETVDITKENCRLLLIRLKMEGWAIGKTKVFLRYYNDEFLARLYEVQVKKVIKVQSMMRALLARKRMKGGKDPKKAKGATRNDEAATKIQKGNKERSEKDFDVEYFDASETPSEAEELFESARKEEALAAARLAEVEQITQMEDD